MKNRTGEKIGWTVGWIGGFVWVAVLSILFLVQGKTEQGLSGLVLTVVALVAVIFFAPWRFPWTRYWRLMLAPYGMFLVSGVWAIWSFGGFGSAGLTWWNLFWLLPMFIPFGTLHKRKWADAETEQNDPADEAEPNH